MKISRKLLIPVITIAVSAVTPAAAFATTGSPAVTSRSAIPARTASLGSSTLQLRKAAAEVVAGFRMPRSVAGAGHTADTADASVPDGPSPEIVPDGTVPSDAAASEFTDCAAEKYDGLCLWQNTGYGGDFWYYSSKTGTVGYSHNEWYYVGGYDNDKASSIYNHRTEGTLVGKNAPPSMPDEVCIIDQAAYGNLTAYEWPDHTTMNDSISSFDFVSSPNC
jgi:hypothetical protein